MKWFIAVFTLCVATMIVAEFTEEEKKAMEPHLNACMKEIGVTKDDIEAAKKVGKVDYENKKVNCFSACMFKKTSVMNEEGAFDMDMIEAFLGPHVAEDVLKKAVEACKISTGPDHCENAAKGIDCFLKNGINIAA